MKHASAYSTPGIRLILSFLLKVSLPAHLLYRAVRHCLPSLDAHLGWGCYTVLTSLLLFLLHILHTHLQTLYHLHRASTLNALPIPSTSGRWPGNIDLLKKWIGIWKNGYPGDIAGRLMVQLGGVETYAVKMCWKNTVFTADPEVIREMLTTDHANYIKGRALTDTLHSVLGSGVFNTNGDLWRFHRSMSRPFFTRDRLKGMLPVFVTHADKALDVLLQRAKSESTQEATQGAVDMQDLASKFTLDAATEFLFGSCVHSLDEELPKPWNAQSPPSSPSTEEKPPSPQPDTLLPLKNTAPSPPPSATQLFPSAFTSALSTLASRLRSGALWPLLEITKDSTKKDVRVIRGFVRKIVKRALERREERERAGEDASADNKEGTLLDHLVTVSDDIQLIQDELINILIAGRDTTASCITFATYLLTQHPEVLERLSEEVHSVLGDDSPQLLPSSTPPSASPSPSSPPVPIPTLETLKRLPYLRAIINETLRLFPSVPMNVRDSVSERIITTSDGTRLYLPAGTGITYSLLHLQRSPKYWGPTAGEFDPVRFLPTGTNTGCPDRMSGDGRYEAYYAKTPFVFMPFNAGPRSCLGQQLAYAEVGVFLCRLVQRLKSTGGKLRLDEDAIPVECRVPREWSESPPPPSPSTLGSSLPFAFYSDEKLPFHSTPTQIALTGSSGSGGMLPATTSTGESPRKRIERVWPKSHLTMFVEGGVWVRT